MTSPAQPSSTGRNPFAVFPAYQRRALLELVEPVEDRQEDLLHDVLERVSWDAETRRPAPDQRKESVVESAKLRRVHWPSRLASGFGLGRPAPRQDASITEHIGHWCVGRATFVKKSQPAGRMILPRPSLPGRTSSSCTERARSHRRARGHRHVPAMLPGRSQHVKKPPMHASIGGLSWLVETSGERPKVSNACHVLGSRERWQRASRPSFALRPPGLRLTHAPIPRPIR